MASYESYLKEIGHTIKEPESGKIYKGKVKSIQPFGAFVEILPGRDGLIHISEISDHRLEKVEDALHIGDEVIVLCLGVDPKGKVKLSIKALNTQQFQQPQPTYNEIALLKNEIELLSSELEKQMRKNDKQHADIKYQINENNRLEEKLSEKKL